jgi:hypothetical protein
MNTVWTALLVLCDIVLALGGLMLLFRPHRIQRWAVEHGKHHPFPDWWKLIMSIDEEWLETKAYRAVLRSGGVGLLLMSMVLLLGIMNGSILGKQI